MSFTPSPAPTAEQKAILRGILSLDTHAEVLEAVSDFDTQEEASAEWALTLTDLTRIDTLKAQNANVKKIADTIEFFEGGSTSDRLSVFNDIRTRYGYEELSTLSPTPVLASTLEWF
jgi:hypothetical protein